MKATLYKIMYIIIHTICYCVCMCIYKYRKHIAWSAQISSRTEASQFPSRSTTPTPAG